MERKKVLGKIIPAVLVLVLALLLVITISSCSKAKKTPTGAIVDEKDYLKINLANDKSYSVSKLEFYNKLRYVGYDVFEDALYEAALIDIVNDIKADIAANGENFDNAKYKKKFKYVIDSEVYGTPEEDEIKNLEDKDKELKEKTYLNGLKQKGYDVDYSKGIYQKASLENMTITLAKREFARAKLLEEMEDIDSENQITTKKIEEYFTNKAVDKSDLCALIILLSSQTEITDTLKQLNLKFSGNKLFRVLPTNETTDYEKYSDYYDDYDTTGKSALNETEVLFEFARLYNYVFPYKAKLQFNIGTTNYLDSTLYPVKTWERSYQDTDLNTIGAFPLTDAIEMLLAQDNTNQDNDDYNKIIRLVYTKEVLDKIDTTLQGTLSKEYLVNSDEKGLYNTPSSTYSRGNYLVFKLKDGAILNYKGIAALANLQNALEANDSASINGHIESIKEEFTDLLKGLGIYDNNEKVKAWAIDYAANIEAFGVKGAKEIVASTKDKENEDSIFFKIFETMLTSDYINTTLKDFLDDECKIYIYDQLFEVQFAQNYDFYKTGNKQSKTDVLKVVVKDGKKKVKSETSITATELFDRLNARYGATEATYALGSHILKDLYYDSGVITDSKKKEYEKQYEQIINYFAQGNSTQYGYSPAIGQKAFVNLYFRADNKEEAIFNMWVSSELQSTLLYSHPEQINGEMYNIFNTLTNISYDNFAHIEYNAISVYTDDDEDGNPDKLEDLSSERQTEVKDLSMKLINLINKRATDEYSNSSRESSYNDLVTKYKAASRVSLNGNYIDGDPEPTNKTSSEKESYYFAAFKQAGIYVTQDISQIIEDGIALEDLDDDLYENQLKKLYQFIITKHSSELSEDYIIARQVVDTDITAEGGGDHIDQVKTVDELFYCEKGFITIYLINTTEAPSFKFEYKDNEDTSTGSKVYPYSTSEENPFPLDENGKVYDNTGAEDSLYNTDDRVSKNQIIVYVREYNDGVESLKLSVVDSFKAYFDTQIMNNYTSETFRYYIYRSLINSYKDQGKLKLNDDLAKQIDNLVEAKQETLFSFKTSELSEKWYEYFK